MGEEEINLEREGENSEHVYGLLACKTLKQIHQKPKTVFIFKNEVKKKGQYKIQSGVRYKGNKPKENKILETSAIVTWE